MTSPTVVRLHAPEPSISTVEDQAEQQQQPHICDHCRQPILSEAERAAKIDSFKEIVRRIVVQAVRQAQQGGRR